MKIIKHLDQQLLSQIDAINTVNGGMVAPVMKYRKVENGYQLTVSIPATAKESLHAEVVNNFLFIYQTVNQHAETLPNSRIINKLPIHFDIDIAAVNAFFEGNTLHVNLPFNGLIGGYRKKLTF